LIKLGIGTNLFNISIPLSLFTFPISSKITILSSNCKIASGDSAAIFFVSTGIMLIVSKSSSFVKEFKIIVANFLFSRFLFDSSGI